MEKIKGTVKWFDNKKGIGFIASNNKEYFVHYSSIKNATGFKCLEPRQEVEFTFSHGPKGYKAEEVFI